MQEITCSNINYWRKISIVS